MKIFKQLKGWIAEMLIPGLIKWLSKSDSKLGKAVKEVNDVYEKIAKDQDGILDENEIKDISTELLEAIAAILNLFGKSVKIRIRKKV